MNYRKLGEEKAIDYFEKHKEMLLNNILEVFTDYIKNNINCIERNGEAQRSFKYESRLYFKGKEKLYFLLSKDVEIGFFRKLCTLIKDELAIKLPDFCEFSVRIIDKSFSNNELAGTLIVYMTVLDNG